jgi:LmbE family N-acetylglucosaminyl deacetylase
MLILETAPDVGGWLEAKGIRRLIVISPHLDDAVFSLGGLIDAAAPITEVATVYTEGTADAECAWALVGGFANPVEEHAARRTEDRSVMEQLGCAFRHLGVRSGELTVLMVRRHLQAMWQHPTHPPAATLVLLPAGAGGTNPPSSARRLWHRVLRRPSGCPAHPDHESTRDHFLEAMSAYPARLGFYAEIPYIWNEPGPQLAARLSAFSAGPLEHVRFLPDVSRKLRTADLYASQARLVLGEKVAYRRRVLKAKENIFLVPEGA